MVRGGPNQLICVDVPKDDASWVACGSKGFSRENCEVKIFDLRGSLQQQAAVACADQTIEALQCHGDQCFIASKDGHLRSLELPEPRVQWERRGHAAYTALGLAAGALLAASAGPQGLALELFALDEEPKLLKSSEET
ncbi:unnamed protein product [Durusdinium trenchii]|uniref:Uncharacterized protein n=1 Tax=Durusdinium trenchii TaxID=1381693 RepID=A0ABP0PDB9_9DINO